MCNYRPEYESLNKFKFSFYEYPYIAYKFGNDEGTKTWWRVAHDDNPRKRLLVNDNTYSSLAEAISAVENLRA